MVNRENHQLIVGRTPKDLDSIKRTLNQIEWFGESTQGELFEFFSRICGRNVAKPHRPFGARHGSVEQVRFFPVEMKVAIPLVD